MKKGLKFLIVVFTLVIFVTGCGNGGKSNLKQYVGTYQGEYTKMVGSDEKETEDFSLELKGDGTGIHKRDGSEFKFTWEIDGENFKMTEKFLGMTIDYSGTLKDGKLDIFNGDKENLWTYEYVYSKK